MPDETQDTKPQLAVTALPHQADLADKLRESPGLLAYHGTGTGKTITAINAANEHQLPLLAVVPAALRNNFRKGIQDAGYTGDHEVLSYEEAMKRLDDPAFQDRASKSLVAFDEAARMGRVESSRSELAHKIPAAKRLFLSGTPIRNGPHEIAPLINAIDPGTLPEDPNEFQAKFLATKETPVGFFGRLVGQTPSKITVPKNLKEFEDAVKGHVHFYQAADRTHFPSYSESTVDVPMASKQQAAYDFVMGKYPSIAYKIRHGLPPSKSEEANFRSFFSGPRQVSNHPAPFHARATDKDAPKIQAVANAIEERKKADPNYRGVAYSAFLTTGIEPISRELTKRGISHNIFTGGEGDAERKRAVDEYNNGTTPVLLISGAGAEGLDLKGTKHIAVMEPHWHEEQIAQVKARGIRYKSHAHLPPDERHVEVQRFHTVPQAGWFDRLLGRQRGTEKSIDEYLYDRAKEKQRVNEPFLRVLKGEPAAAVEADVNKQSEFQEPAFDDGNVLHVPYMEERRPGILFDLDDTLVKVTDWMDPNSQTVLPDRLTMLHTLKDRGYAIVGITNRACYTAEQTPDMVDQHCVRTHRLLNGLLEDIFYINGKPGPSHKPSPDMLIAALHRHGIDADNCIMVGDSPDDKNAAAAIGIPWYHPDDFFKLTKHAIPHARELALPATFEEAST